MKFLLIGADGKMGKEIQSILSEKKSDSYVCFDKNYSNFEEILQKNSKFDAIIDFSTAKSRTEYFCFSKQNSIPYACFSTNLSFEDEQNLKSLSEFVPVLCCTNASPGMNIFFKLTELICKYLPECDIVLTENHHKYKLDTPSGTAKQIEKILTSNNKNFTTHSNRVGNERGFHKLEFFLEDEVITISHQANSRKIFALGAIELTRNLCSLPPKFYINL